MKIEYQQDSYKDKVIGIFNFWKHKYVSLNDEGKIERSFAKFKGNPFKLETKDYTIYYYNKYMHSNSNIVINNNTPPKEEISFLNDWKRFMETGYMPIIIGYSNQNGFYVNPKYAVE